MNEIRVDKLDGHGRVVVAYTGTICERFTGGIRLEARWELPSRNLGYTRFEPGDRFIEWFYTDRWYNIFEIHASGSDALKGWYCNIAAPATIVGGVVRSRDLLLDLWVRPDGTTLVLDEDEFAADTTLDVATRATAEAALRELSALVARREPPFHVIATSNGAVSPPTG